MNPRPPSSSFDWRAFREEWIVSAREISTEELVRLERAYRRSSFSDTDAAEEAIEVAIRAACARHREEIPWYFASGERFCRWVTIVAFRNWHQLPTPPRVA